MKLLLATLAVLFSANAFAGSTWYSSTYHKSYDKSGHCSQYNYTDTRTCNTPKDYLKCDWNSHTRTCYKEKKHSGGGHDTGYNKCSHDEWYSSHYRRCYKKRSYCSQYNYTDYNTCNSPKDRMRCDWDHKRSTCYEEKKSSGHHGY